MQMGRTTQKDVEAIPCVFFAHGSVLPVPIRFRLSARGSRYHSHSIGKPFHYLVLGGARRFGEFAITIANVSGLGNPGANVVIQIAG